MKDIFNNPKLYMSLLYVVFGIISYLIIKYLIKRILNNKSIKVKDRKRYNTIIKMLFDLIKLIVFIIVVILILSAYKVDVKSILTGLGLMGAIIGFALQDLLKDLISGASIVIEGYFSIGDVIEIDGFKGEVIDVGIKSTRIKKWDGSLLIINNRYITKIINNTNYNSTAIVDVPINVKENSLKVINILQEELTNFKTEFLIGEVKVLGVLTSDEKTQVIRIIGETESEKQYAPERRIREQAYQILNKHNINYQIYEVKNNGK